MMNGSTVEVLFGEATTEQQPECYVLAASAWGSYLDEEEVIERERHLASQPLALNAGCQIWCLYRRDDHSQIVSTCKTLRRDLLLSNKEGVSEVQGFCISSVVTALLYRGHGLASCMLQNVAQWLDGHGQATVSLLYSGIPHFYENVGWTALQNTEMILSNSPWLRDVLGTYADLETRFLSSADIERLCARDVELLRAEAQQIEVGVRRRKLTVLPKANLVRYQHALADYMGNLWHYEAPKNRGTAYEDQAWIYWYHDFRGRCLCIQRVHNAIRDQERGLDIMAALLLGAYREAQEWNFTTIVTWDTSLNVRNALEMLARDSIFTKSVSERQRTQMISLRWRNGEKTIVDTEMDNEAYVWNLRS